MNHTQFTAETARVHQAAAVRARAANARELRRRLVTELTAMPRSSRWLVVDYVPLALVRRLLEGQL